MREKRVKYFWLIFWGFFILIISTIIFFLLYKEKKAFSLALNCNDDIRTYVSYISAWIASSISFAGLVLGFFYYVSKLKNDVEYNNEKCRAAKYQFLMNEIDFCDKIIENFYHKKVEDENIKIMEDELTKHSVIINKYFENNNISLFCKDNTPTPLSKWNSFINTAEIVRIRQKKEIDTIRKDEHSEYKNIYSNVKIYLVDISIV